MQMSDLLPFDHDAQRTLERAWAWTVAERRAAEGVRPAVRASWPLQSSLLNCMHLVSKISMWKN